MMEDERIRQYLEYLEKSGYTHHALKQTQMRVGWFLKMFPDEKQWDSLHIKNFLEIKQQMGKMRKASDLKESYLHSLEGYIRRFLGIGGRKKNFKRPNQCLLFRCGKKNFRTTLIIAPPIRG